MSKGSGSAFLKSLSVLVVVVGIVACAPSAKYQSGDALDSSSNAETAGIIGGQEVKPTESAAQTSVMVYDTAAKALCTGSLVGNNIVLTAAHCLGQDPRRLLVVFSMNLSTAKKEMTRPVVGAVANPLWRTNSNKPKDNGDIALIKYEGPTPAGYKAVTFLPNVSALKTGSTIVLAGYGLSDGVKKTGAGVLREVMTTIANSQFSPTELEIEQRQGRGACHGDSGGPAFVLANGVYYLWGVTSRGDQDVKDQCSGFSIYTDVLAYTKWIQDTARALIIANQFSFPQTTKERIFGSGTYY